MMTPGFAKTRAELPGLPYPEKDRVIINAHNFPSSEWTPAVNGKNPIAAWVPSRDTDGNGTTTLTDLAGASDSTLTNMDAATDWVSDTDAGGVRALDFDGTNDLCINNDAFALFTSGTWTVSLWAYDRTAGARAFVGFGDSTSTGRYVYIFNNSGTVQVNAFGAAQGNLAATFGAMSTDTWTHFVFGMSASGLFLYKDGSIVTPTVTVGTNNQKTWSTGQINRNAIGALRRSSTGSYLNGRMDDIRVFDSVLDSTDVADLHASGAGRGVQA